MSASRGASPDLPRKSDRLRAHAISRSPSLADSTTTWGPGSASRPRSSAFICSPMITWAFVPPNPKELIPAILGRTRPEPSAGGSQGPISVTMRNGVSSSRIWGLGVSIWRLAGSLPCLRESSTLITPAMPAAASRCPMLVFTEPSQQRLAASGRDCPHISANARLRPLTSTGSPRAVPVPWAST